MKTKLLLVCFLLTFTFVSAQEKRALTIEDLWNMKRAGGLTLSPDGHHIAYSLTSYSMNENKGKTSVYMTGITGEGEILIEEGASSPSFRPGTDKLAYVKDGALYQVNYDGSGREKIAEVYTGISGVIWHKDGNKFLFNSSVYPDCEDMGCNKTRDEQEEKDPVDARIFTELLYRHWNEWRGPQRSHLFLYDLTSDKFFDLTYKSENDIPTIALGGSHDFDISPDGTEAAFTMNDEPFKAASTNNDIYLVNLASPEKHAEPEFTKISESKGNDNQPVYSPDGKYIAFRSMARAGFEADKQSIMLYDRESRTITNLTENVDISAGELIWSTDSETIYFTAANQIYNSIYKVNVSGGEPEIILEDGDNSSIVLSPEGNRLFFFRQNSRMPNEVFSMNTDGSGLKQITSINGDLLSGIEMSETETIWVEGAEGARVQSIVIKPPFFEEGKKYPMVFLIHGGPQGHWTDDFHFRWNMQMFAAPGYVVVAPNPRGSVGYGQQFTDEISMDWGGKVYEDLMNTYDYAVNELGYIDANNTFAAGASYGGYMINWIEGHTDRFNALICHAGVYDLQSMYGATEELWFPEWEFGGAPWENPKLYKKWSPSSYVENFKTPMLVIHGANDFRVPESQAFQLFTALQKMKVESKFLYYPDEYHFVTKPQNARLWWNTIYDWVDGYIKE